MAAELLSEITEDCDVEVTHGNNMGRSFAIKVRDCSKWAENFHKPEEALAALIAVREAGYKVPQHVTKKIAETIVKRTFKTGDRL